MDPVFHKPPAQLSMAAVCKNLDFLLKLVSNMNKGRVIGQSKNPSRHFDSTAGTNNIKGELRSF